MLSFEEPQEHFCGRFSNFAKRNGENLSAHERSNGKSDLDWYRNKKEKKFGFASKWKVGSGPLKK